MTRWLGDLDDRDGWWKNMRPYGLMRNSFEAPGTRVDTWV